MFLAWIQQGLKHLAAENINRVDRISTNKAMFDIDTEAALLANIIYAAFLKPPSV